MLPDHSLIEKAWIQRRNIKEISQILLKHRGVRLGYQVMPDAPEEQHVKLQERSYSPRWAYLMLLLVLFCLSCALFAKKCQANKQSIIFHWLQRAVGDTQQVQVYGQDQTATTEWGKSVFWNKERLHGKILLLWART